MDAASLPGGPAFSKLAQAYRHYLDKTTPHVAARWAALALVVLVYAVRAYLLRGFYIITYALGIYNLNLLLGFLTPQARAVGVLMLSYDRERVKVLQRAGCGKVVTDALPHA